MTRHLSTDKYLTDDHYKAIGKIAVEWTYVELDVCSIIWHMLDLVGGKEKAMTAHAITANLGSVTLLDLLKTLVHNKVGDSDEYKAFTKFVSKDFNDLRILRNEIVHGLYYRSADFPEKAALHKVSAKGKLKLDFIKRSVSDLEKVAQDIADLRESLDKLAVWKHALPKKFVGPHR